MTTPCPKCSVPIEHPAPMPAAQNRVVDRFVQHDCGANIRFATREGWDRWYATHWSDHSARTDGLPERSEYYARLDGKPALRSVP